MPRSPDKIPDNIDYIVEELLEALEVDPPAMTCCGDHRQGADQRLLRTSRALVLGRSRSMSLIKAIRGCLSHRALLALRKPFKAGLLIDIAASLSAHKLRHPGWNRLAVTRFNSGVVQSSCFSRADDNSRTCS